MRLSVVSLSEVVLCTAIATLAVASLYGNRNWKEQSVPTAN